MDVPIERLLKTPQQINLARLQDAIVESVYEIDSNIVMHGGTAIWRCYNGNRFSDDVDIYLSEREFAKLNKEFTWKLPRRNLKMDYPTGIGSKIFVYNDYARTKLEVMNKPKTLKSVARAYQKIDGSALVIKTLTAEDFIFEKIDTYSSREYIRDIYDIFHLMSVEKLDKRIRSALVEFIKTVKRPKDEEKLKELVYSGSIPTFDEMIESIRERLK